MSNLEQWLQSTDLHYLIAHYSDLETLRQEKAANILLATWFSCKMTSNKEQAQKFRTVDVSLPRQTGLVPSIGEGMFFPMQHNQTEALPRFG